MDARPTTPADLAVVFEDDSLRISEIAAAAPDAPLMISFTGLGGKTDVMQDDEFVGSATQDGAGGLFVIDKTRSWYNTDGVYERILEVVGPRAAAAPRVVTLGNSMGGFGALLFAGPLGAQAAVAFSPQVSISARVIPEETRWAEFVAKVKSVRFEDANDYMTGDLDYLVLHGAGARDAYHVEAFRPRPRLRHYVFAGVGHHVGAKLKDAGVLAPMVAAAARGDLAAFDALALGAGGAERGPPGAALESLEAARAARRARRKRERQALRGRGDAVS